MIRSIVERIYIVDRDDERYCHIFIKGCTGEDYTGFFQTAGYIEKNTAPVCDSEQDCIIYMIIYYISVILMDNIKNLLSTGKTLKMYRRSMQNTYMVCIWNISRCTCCCKEDM